MTVTFDIDAGAFADSLKAEFARVKVPCQAAMAHTFATVVNHNFGEDGEDRPTDWAPLSKNYAGQFHDGNRTPTLRLMGELQSSIDINENEEDCAEVFTHNPYAAMHQFGEKNEDGYQLPARPFFPIIGFEVSPYTTQKCLDACIEALERNLK